MILAFYNRSFLGRSMSVFTIKYSLDLDQSFAVSSSFGSKKCGVAVGEASVKFMVCVKVSLSDGLAFGLAYELYTFMSPSSLSVSCPSSLDCSMLGNAPWLTCIPLLCSEASGSASYEGIFVSQSIYVSRSYLYSMAFSICFSSWITFSSSIITVSSHGLICSTFSGSGIAICLFRYIDEYIGSLRWYFLALSSLNTGDALSNVFSVLLFPGLPSLPSRFRNSLSRRFINRYGLIWHWQWFGSMYW